MLVTSLFATFLFLSGMIFMKKKINGISRFGFLLWISVPFVALAGAQTKAHQDQENRNLLHHGDWIGELRGKGNPSFSPIFR